MIQACQRGGRGNQAGSRGFNVWRARKFRTPKGELFVGKPGHESGHLKNLKRARELRKLPPPAFRDGGPIPATICRAVKIASLVTSITVWLFALS